MIELHGSDINHDEHIVSRLGQIGVEHYALGALYSRFKYDDSLDQYADLLVKMILKLEAESLSASENKYQEWVAYFYR